MFQLVERVLARLTPVKKPSRVSRLVARDTIIGTLDEEMRASSENNCAW